MKSKKLMILPRGLLLMSIGIIAGCASGPQEAEARPPAPDEIVLPARPAMRELPSPPPVDTDEDYADWVIWASGIIGYFSDLAESYEIWCDTVEQIIHGGD